MSSQRQIQANRRNAKLSTGPKSPEGKAKSSKNGLTHGCYCSEVVLPDEDREAFDALATEIEEEFQPATPTEGHLIQIMAESRWRLSRIIRMETGILTRRLADARSCYQYDEDHVPPTCAEEVHAENTRALGGAVLSDAAGCNSLVKLSHLESRLDCKYFRALRELRAAQKHRRPTPPPANPQKTDDPNPIPKSDTPQPPGKGGACAQTNAAPPVRPILDFSTSCLLDFFPPQQPPIPQQTHIICGISNTRIAHVLHF